MVSLAMSRVCKVKPGNEAELKPCLHSKFHSESELERGPVNSDGYFHISLPSSQPRSSGSLRQRAMLETVTTREQGQLNDSTCVLIRLHRHSLLVPRFNSMVVPFPLPPDAEQYSTP